MIISNFTKGKTFSSLMTTKCSWGILTTATTFSLTKTIICLETQLKAELTDWF